jgi:hydroxypyruvate reductase
MEARMDVDLLIATDIPPFMRAPLEERYRCHDLYRAKNRRTLFGEVAASIRGIACKGHGPIDKGMIDELPKLEIISCFGVGIDGVDFKSAQARGIAVTNTPDVLTECVADLAVGLLISAVREIALADRYVRAGRWTREGDMALSARVHGKRLGILGLGRIGEAIAKRAAGFGLAINYHNRRRKSVPFAYFEDARSLAEASDFLVVCCPGGSETRHLVDMAVLKALGSKGFLINVSRGSVVDEDALVRALEQRWIAGAGLDVFDNEPYVPETLLRLDNVTLLPHIASATRETRQAMADLAVANLDAHFSGQPLLTPFSL